MHVIGSFGQEETSQFLECQARVGHQELEAGVNRVVKLLAHETKTHKQKLMQQHKVLKEVLSMQRSAKVPHLHTATI